MAALRTLYRENGLAYDCIGVLFAVSNLYSVATDASTGKISFEAKSDGGNMGEWSVSLQRPKSGEGTPKIGTTYIDIDPNSIMDGDIVSLGGGASAVWREGDTVESFAKKLQLGTEGVDYALDGNRLALYKVVDQDYIDDGFKPIAPKPNSYGIMKIQVGALEGEQLSIEIKAMNSFGLGLDKTDLSTQDGAGNAISATRSAINMVSDQRALLGAMQNRLEHKISNLDNTAENLQSAESRIRDVDVAKEMSNYTKNNILMQSSTAMLAQANAAPQGVLSLLQSGR